MAVDFDKLVLSPCMSTFGREVTIDPVDSRPGEPPYKARGVFKSVAMDTDVMDGVTLGDQKTWFGLRLSDYDGRPPIARDRVTINDVQGTTGPTRYYITAVEMDGEGGGMARLRLITPDDPIPP
jgi:hypothetical protein